MRGARLNRSFLTLSALVGLIFGFAFSAKADPYGYSHSTVGYEWETLTAAGGGPSHSYSTVGYTWHNCSRTGWGPSNDDGYSTVSIGFNFPFYDNSYSTVHIGTNGFMGFGSTSRMYDYSPDSIPNSNDPDNIVAPLWTDLNPSRGGSIWYCRTTAYGQQALVVNWSGVPYYYNTSANTFQAILLANGEIRFNYDYVASYRTYTTGVENQNGTIGTQAWRRSSAMNDVSLRFTPPGGAGGSVNAQYVSFSDDSVRGGYNLGFNFDFYGNNYSQAWFSSNGFLAFQNPGHSYCCNGNQLGVGQGPRAIIAGYWNDMNHSSGLYGTLGNAPNRRFVFQHTGQEYSSGPAQEYQVVLYETSNSIKVNIRNASRNSHRVTTGIQNYDRNYHQTYIYGYPGAISNTSILFERDNSAEVSWVTLTNQNNALPGLRGSWALDRAAQTRSRLYMGSSVSGTGCNGGTLIKDTNHGSNTSVNYDFNNTSGWHSLERDRTYCLQVDVLDDWGHRRSAARTITNNNPSISGSLDQAAGTATITGSWSDNAANNASMQLVLEENCTGAVVQTESIAWNATGSVSKTYTLDREQNYCARLVMGGRTVTTNLGRLNHSTLSAVSVSLQNAAIPRIRGSYSLSHAAPVTVSLYGNSTTTNNQTCTGGSLVGSSQQGTSQSENKDWESSQAHPLIRGATYCMLFSVEDGGLNKEARQYTIPDNNVSLSGSIDQGAATATLDALWDGNAGGDSSITLYRSANCGSNFVGTQAISWNQNGGISHTFTGLSRGNDYCARLSVGQVTATVDLGRLNFGSISSLSLNGNTTNATLSGSWQLTHAAPHTAVLYEASSDAGNACSGGTQIWTQAYGVSSSQTPSWVNSGGWQELERGTDYCLELTVDDGGGSSTADGFNLAAPGSSLGYSMDQDAASLTITGNWTGRAGADARLLVYPNADCSGAALVTEAIAYDRQNNQTKTWTTATGLTRNTHYCGALELGDARVTRDLGLLEDYARISSLNLTMSSADDPTLTVTWQLSRQSAVTTRLLMNSTRSGDSCVGGTEVSALLELPNEVSGEFHWNNTDQDIFLERGRTYCMEFRTTDGGNVVTARDYTIPDNITGLTAYVDQEASAFGVGGGWTGNAGGNAWLRLYATGDCTGAHIEHVDIGWQAQASEVLEYSFREDYTRGVDHCARLQLGAVSRTVFVGQLGYASFRDVTFSITDANLPRVSAGWGLSYAAQTVMTLFENSQADGNGCSGGTVLESLTLDSSDTFTRAWENTLANHVLRRGRSYCLYLSTNDGGDSKVARDVVIEAPNLGVTGTLGQEQAIVNVVGSWTGLAGATSFVELYRNANCSGAALYQVPIAWNQNAGVTQSFDSADYPEVLRGNDYCGKIVLGDASETASLGRLEFATFSANQFTVYDAQWPTLQSKYWLSYPAPVTSRLFGGNYTLSGDQCVGGTLMSTLNDAAAQQGTNEWVNSAGATLARGTSYCMQWDVAQGDGDTAALELTIPDNIVALSGTVDAAAGSFTVDGSWVGRAGGDSVLELYDNETCSGAPVATESITWDSVSASVLPHTFTGDFTRGLTYCARLSLGLATRTTVLGELEFAHIDSLELTLTDSNTPLLTGEWTMSHAAATRTTLYRNSVAAGNTCSGSDAGVSRVEIETTDHAAATTGTRQWQNSVGHSILERSRHYCLLLQGQDGGDSVSATTVLVNSGTPAVSGTIDQNEMVITVTGSWTGNAGAGASVELYKSSDCSGAAFFSQAISALQPDGQSVSVSAADYPVIERGHEYCGRVVLGGSAATGSLGSLDFATIDSASLGLSDAITPALNANISLSRETPLTITLYDGATRDGDNCTGGVLVSAATHTSALHTETFTSSVGHPFTRGGTYCAKFELNDGGGAHTAREYIIPGNILDLGGTINQAAASFTITGSWTGYAGANSRLLLFQSATCSGQPIQEQNIAWDGVSGTVLPFDFVSDDTPYVRGQQYCVRLELGDASRNYSLGELDYAYVTETTLTSVDALRPSIRVSWTLSHATGVELQLYKDSVANGNQCAGGALVDTQEPAESLTGTHTWDNDVLWHELDRGVSYCVIAQARDGGGSLRSASTVVPGANATVSGAIDQVDGVISLEAGWDGRAGGDSAIELFRSDDCSGVAIATYTMGFADVGPIDGALFADELDSIARGFPYCVRIRMGGDQTIASLGMFDFVEFTDAELVLSSGEIPALRAGYTLTHDSPVRVRLYDGATISGGDTCTGGTQVGTEQQGNGVSYGAVFASSQQWPLRRGSLYCAQFSSTDSGNAKAAATYSLPDGVIEFSGSLDQVNGTISVSGEWQGMAGADSVLTLHNDATCSGAPIDSTAISWNSISDVFLPYVFSDDDGFGRGVNYCAALKIGAVTHTYQLGELEYAHIENPTFVVTHAQPPSVQANWDMNHRAATRATLYEQSTAQGHSCSGGEVVALHDLAAEQSFQLLWENDDAWENLARGRSYCVHLETLDGGESAVAMDVVLPTGNPSVTGVIDQVSGEITVTGAWEGLAAHDAQIEMYKNTDCSGAAAFTEALPWSTLQGVEKTYGEATAAWLTRASAYCARIRLGEAVVQVSLGTLDTAAFTTVNLAASNLVTLDLVAQFETNHAVQVTQTLHEGATASGGDCVGGNQLGSAHVTTAESESYEWASAAAMPLKRGALYCVRFVAGDSGAASASAQYQVPDNINALGGFINQETAEMTINGGFNGIAGGASRIDLHSNSGCSGAPIQTSAITWNSTGAGVFPHTFVPPETGFTRGVGYCARLILGNVSRTVDLGQLTYANLSAIAFDVANENLPSLAASWTLSHATTSRSKLYKGSSAAGSNCAGGLEVSVSDHAHNATTAVGFENLETWLHLERGVSYCVEVEVTDGGGAKTARSVSVPSNTPGLTGSIDQADGSMSLTGTWTGQAGAASQLELYKNATCSGDAIATSAIGYAGTVPYAHVFTVDDVGSIERGYSYCARLRFGNVTTQIDLGQLVFAEFLATGLVLDDVNTPTLAASHQMNHAVEVRQSLYYGASILNDRCDGGTQIDTERVTAVESSTQLWASSSTWPLRRGGSYCMEWATTDGGGAGQAVVYTIPSNITALSGVVDQENATFTVSGAWTGQAGGAAKLELFANADCTGASIRSVDSAWDALSSASLPYVFEPGDDGFQRGLNYCVQLTLGDARQSFGLGELEYAHIAGPEFTVSDGGLPSLTATWSLSHATTSRTKLFKGSTAAGNVCSGGDLIESHEHSHKSTFNRSWLNTADSLILERGAEYCVEILVTDGGNAQTARGVMAPTNNPVLTGDIDQVTGAISVGATWAGQAGASTFAQLFASAECSGAEIARAEIGYDTQGGFSHTFSPDAIAELVRGQSYCARLTVGLQVQDVPLGTLDFVTFDSVSLTLANSATPSLRASYTLNHDSPVLVELYRGASLAGDDTCSGGVLTFTQRTTNGASHDEIFESSATDSLWRATQYCVQFLSTDSGGARAAAVYIVPAASTAFSGNMNQDEATILVNGGWNGQAGGNASVSVFQNENCTGAALAQREVLWDELSSAVFAYTFDPGGQGLARGYEYCVQLELGNDVRTINLGELEFGFIDAISFTSGDQALPSLDASWSLNHRVATESVLYRDSVSAGHVCTGDGRVEIHRETHETLSTASQNWANVEQWQNLARATSYCLEVKVLDAEAYQTARTFEFPDNDSFVQGDLDVDTATVTLTGFWTGNAGAFAALELFPTSDCSGDALDIAPIAYNEADGYTYVVDPADLPTLVRGASYCGRLTLGGAIHDVPLGELPFADITSLDLIVSNAATPELEATWELEPNGPTTATLYAGSTLNAEETACVGGTLVAESSVTVDHADGGTHQWTNSQGWHPLKRGATYCAQVETEDGGNVTKADTVVLAATGISLAGSIDQDNGLLTFDAGWDGNAGAGASVVLYRSANCTQNPVTVESIEWNQSTTWTHTWDKDDHPGILRGHDYCARLILGDVVVDHPLGFLVEWAFIDSLVISAEQENIPSVRSSWVLSQDEVTTTTLYLGGGVNGDTCEGGTLIDTQDHNGTARTVLWENTQQWHVLERGRDYCVQLDVQDTGSDEASAAMLLGDASMNLSASVNQNESSFTVTGAWQGNAGAAASLTLYQSSDCSDNPLRVVDIAWDVASGVQEVFTPGNTPELERGASYCAKLVLGGAETIHALGELHYSSISALSFTMTDPWDPTLRGQWTLTPMGTSSATLYEGGTAQGGVCDGGEAVVSGNYGHLESVVADWQNTGLLKRGATYCLEVNTLDGGEETASTDFSVPANNPAMIATLNQVTATVTVEASWDGRAGAASSVTLYRSSNCASVPAETRAIPWDLAGGDDFDFTEADGSVIRGFDYCVALDIGDVRLTQSVGFLVAFGLFDQVTFNVDDVDAPSLTASWTMSQPTVTTTQLYRNSVVNEAGDGCIGADSELVLEQTHDHLQAVTQDWVNSETWHELTRGLTYCLHIQTDDGGNQHIAEELNLGGTLGFVAGTLDEYAPGITVSASWSGSAGGGPAYVGFYLAEGGACGECAPELESRRDILWDTLGGDQYTFIDVSETRLVRGEDYCACMRLGGLESSVYVGELGGVPPRYRETLVEVDGSLETLYENYEDEDFAESLNTARGHIGYALAYWDARTSLSEVGEFGNRQIQWGPSFRRAQKAVEEMVRARTSGGPGSLRGMESRIGSVMLYEARLRASINQEELDSTSPGWWLRATELSYSTAQNGFQSLYGLERADAAADAYDAAAPVYEQQYQLANQVSRAQVAVDAQMAQPRENRPRLELIGAIDAIMISGLKPELEAAVEVSLTGREKLEAVIGRLENIDACLEDLAAFVLNDKQFTLCYLDVVEIVEELESFESALVNTHTWRALLGYSVFALLDISLYHGSNPLVIQPNIDGDDEGQEAFDNFELGLLELRNGDIDTSLDRYMRNDCLIVRMFNRYYAIPGGGANFDEIEEAGYCPQSSNECVVPDTCSEAATCIDRIVGYECLCDEGFELNNVNECVDIDECTFGISTCSPVAECTNEIGSFTCECPEGFGGEFCSVCETGYAGVLCDQCDVNAGFVEFPLMSGLCIADPCVGQSCLGLDSCSPDSTGLVTETGVCSVLGPDSFTCSSFITACNPGTACNGVDGVNANCVVEPFFSEYIEGSSWNKALEIYNPNEEAFNLEHCWIEIYSNGSTEVGYSVELSDVVGGYETQVLCNDRIDENEVGRCDILENSLIFNGDDAVALICGGAGDALERRIADVIGQVGNDPGSSWGTGNLSTKNATLRRDCGVVIGDDVKDDAFTPADSFVGEDIDVFDGLGAHCD